MNRSHVPIARILLLSILSLGLFAAQLPAAGGSPSATPPPTATAPQDPMMAAKMHYNNGVRLREKAAKLHEKLAAAPEAKRAKIEQRIANTYAEATQEYIKAVNFDREHHQAFSDLGYVLRKQGQYEQALAAYDVALELEPSYAEAIEYRGEAYLGLNRLEDAKSAYMTLFAQDRSRADELMTAMESWLEKRRAEPAGVDQAELESFAAWISERQQIAGFVPGHDDDERVARAW